MDRLVESIRRHEGVVRDSSGDHAAYLDSLGKLTIGFGTLLDDRLTISDDMAVGLMLSEIEEKRDRLQHVDGFLELSSVRQDVLLEMAYQMGVGGLLHFKRMWSALRAEEWENAADEMMDSRWATKQSPGRAATLAWRMRHDEWEVVGG